MRLQHRFQRRLQMFADVGWGLMEVRNPGTHHCSRPTQSFRTCGRPGERLQGPYRRLWLLQSTVGHAEKQRHVEGSNRRQRTLQLLEGLHGLLRPLIDEVDDPFIKTCRITYVMQLRPLRGKVRGRTGKMLA
jgi:hypothetical protein